MKFQISLNIKSVHLLIVNSVTGQRVPKSGWFGSASSAYRIDQRRWLDCVDAHDYLDLHCWQMSQRTTKPTIRPVQPAKTQINLYIYPVWKGFSFIPLWIAWRLWKAMRSVKTLIRLRRCAVWSVFAVRTRLIVGFLSCPDSDDKLTCF